MKSDKHLARSNCRCHYNLDHGEREEKKKKRLKTAEGYCNIKTLRKRKKKKNPGLKELYKNVSTPASFLKEK